MNDVEKIKILDRDSNSNLSIAQTVASRYTDYAIPAHYYVSVSNTNNPKFVDTFNFWLFQISCVHTQQFAILCHEQIYRAIPCVVAMPYEDNNNRIYFSIYYLFNSPKANYKVSARNIHKQERQNEATASLR
jgi:hypothetical protein